MLAFDEILKVFNFAGGGELMDCPEDVGVFEECFGEFLFAPVGCSS